MSGEGGPIPATEHIPFNFAKREWPVVTASSARTDSREKALAAAHAAQEAIAELIRFVREGAASRRPPFGEIECVELLADALVQTLEVESAEHDADGHPDDAEARNQLLGALKRFLDGWVP